LADFCNNDDIADELMSSLSISHMIKKIVIESDISRKNRSLKVSDDLELNNSACALPGQEPVTSKNQTKEEEKPLCGNVSSKVVGVVPPQCSLIYQVKITVPHTLTV
jgi:hypothetical protein